MASELQTPVHALLMCAAALGWSGLSVHLQIATICSGRNISLTPYFIAKAAQGVICLVLVGVLLRLFPFSDNVYQSFYDSSTATGYSNANYLCLAFFVAALLPVVIIEVRRTYMNFAKRQMNWHSP